MSVPLWPLTPVNVAFPFVRSNLGFAVIKQQNISGRRTRYAQRNLPIWQWKPDLSVLRAGIVNGAAYTELQTIMGFYNTLLGTQSAFSYPDDTDNSVTNQPFGIGDGVSTAFQLVRTFGTFTEPVYLPQGTPTIFNNGSPVSGSNYTISPAGIVTFTSAPTNGVSLTWTGTYNWLVRFDVDKVDFTEILSQLWKVNQLTFSSEIL